MSPTYKECKTLEEMQALKMKKHKSMSRKKVGIQLVSQSTKDLINMKTSLEKFKSVHKSMLYKKRRKPLTSSGK